MSRPGSLNPMYGKHHSLEARRKISETKLKRHNEISETFKKLWKDPEYRSKHVEADKKAWKNALVQKNHALAMNRPDYRQKRSQKHKKYWAENRTFLEEKIHNWWIGLSPNQQLEICQRVQNIERRPTIPELKCQAILKRVYPGQWKYAGNGQIWIARKNPDFINCNGKKAVIEVLGTHWHAKEDEVILPHHYAKYGFKCLTIWETEFKDEEKLLQKLSEFHESFECGSKHS